MPATPRKTAAGRVQRLPAPAADPPPTRHEQIAAAAYRRAEARGFAPGRELDDWLDAEREVDADTVMR